MVNATTVDTVETVTTVDTGESGTMVTAVTTDTEATAVNEEHTADAVEIVAETDHAVDLATTVAATCPLATGNTAEAGEVEEATLPDPLTDTTSKQHNDHVKTPKPNYDS